MRKRISTINFSIFPAIIFSFLLLYTGMVHADDTDTGGVEISKLERIVIHEDASSREMSAANTLRRHLADRYKLSLDIGTRSSGFSTMTNTVFVGRDAALGSGLISENELNEVKYDGFVIKVKDGNIAVSGHRDLGTIFGVERLLEELGIKYYYNDVIYKPRISVIDNISISDKEKFGFRDAGRWSTLGQGDNGRVSARDITASIMNPLWFAWHGNPGFLGHYSSHHSAPALMPPPLFHSFDDENFEYPDPGDHPEYYPAYYGYDYNPEYYAMRGGSRISATTSMNRVNLCLSNPDVWEITTKRVLEWIALQPERKYFWVTDGDGRYCECDECRALDPKYGPPTRAFATDRQILWVNHVAREVKKVYPDKTILTFAYMESVPPPTEEGLEDNVVVMYAPWWRDSRNAAGRDWIHPYNLHAMKQFIDWVVKFPGQVGLYDYTPNWGDDLVHYEQHKMWGSHNVPAVWYDGHVTDYSDMSHYIRGKTFWNPDQSLIELRNEYLNALYGPGGPYLQEYFDAIDEYNHSFARRESTITPRKGPQSDPDFVVFSLEQFKQAEEAVIEGPLELEETLGPWEQFHEWTREEKILYRLRPMEKPLVSDALDRWEMDKIYDENDLEVYRNRVARYLHLQLYGIVIPAATNYFPRRYHPGGGITPAYVASAVNRLKNILLDYAGFDEEYDDIFQMEWVINNTEFNPDVKTAIETIIADPEKNIIPGYDYSGNEPPEDEQDAAELSIPPIILDEEEQLNEWQVSGFNSYAEMDGPIIPANDDFEFTVWVNLDKHDIAAHSMLFHQRGDDGSNFNLYAHIGWSGMRRVRFDLGGGHSNSIYGTDIRGEGWVKITVTRSGSVFTLYQGDVSKGTLVENVSIAQKSAYLGMRNNDCFLQGKVESMSIRVNDSLTGSWAMDEGSGDIIYDKVGSNNGKIIQPVWVKKNKDNVLYFQGGVASAKLLEHQFPDETRFTGTNAFFSLTALLIDETIGLRAGNLGMSYTFPAKVDISNAGTIEITIHVSGNYPVPGFFRTGTDKGSRSWSTYLFPGKQIIRKDMPEGATELTSLRIQLQPHERYPRVFTWDPSKVAETEDVAVTVFSVGARNYLPQPSELGSANVLWTSRSRSSHQLGTWNEPFRSFHRNSELYPIYSITVKDGEYGAEAKYLQGKLKEIYGVELPIMPPEESGFLGNTIMLGNELALTGNMVRQEELNYIRGDGYLLHGEGGRVAIAGSVMEGIERFIYERGPDRFSDDPDMTDVYMHEIYLVKRGDEFDLEHSDETELKGTTDSGIPISWLEEHNLATDGSQDHERIGDSPFTVREEWIAGTNPNDPDDILRFTEPLSETYDGLRLSWRGVTDRTYTIERSEDLTGDPQFEILATGIKGLEGVSEYMDPSAMEAGPYMYRVSTVLPDLSATADIVHSANIVGFHRMRMEPGRNFVGLNFRYPEGKTYYCIQELLDTSKLRGGITKFESDQLYLWDAASQRYIELWLADSDGMMPEIDGKWWDEAADNPDLGISGDVAKQQIYPGDGFWLILNQRNRDWEKEKVEIFLSGEVMENEIFEHAALDGSSLLASAWPVDIGVNEMDLTGVEGSTSRLGSDRLFLWDMDKQRYIELWLFDSDGIMAEYDGKWWDPKADNPDPGIRGNVAEQVLEAGSAMWLMRHNYSELIEGRPY